MIRYFFSIALFFCIIIQSLGQKHDFTWRVASRYFEWQIIDRGVVTLDFNQGSPEITVDSREGGTRLNCTPMSDKDGNLLFLSNGLRLYDAEMNVIPNSDGFNSFSVDHEGDETSGLSTLQGSLSLPWPDSLDKYLLLQSSIEVLIDSTSVEIVSPYLRYSTLISTPMGVQLNEKGKLLLDLPLTSGGLSAVRHGNGRDWWIFVLARYENLFYRFLFSPSGISLAGTQRVGEIPKANEFTFSGFSPDGNWYFRNINISTYSAGYCHLYRMDRANGVLSDPIKIDYTVLGFSASGSTFSPNSQYFYRSDGYKIYQYDMLSSDIVASEMVVGEYDGKAIFQTYQQPVFLAQLAPDGKIYWCVEGSSGHYHVINFPNRRGKACGFEQFGLTIPQVMRYDRSIPYYPNYRLGPEDGTVCDSLGIDNVPMAWWGYDVDTLAKAVVQFRDNSFYKPTSRFWDFGDGHTSTEEYPIHYYKIGRVYEACLTVSNEYGTDELCRTFDFTKAAFGGFTSGEAPPSGLLLEDEEAFDLAEGVLVYPNPTSNELYIKIPDNLPIERIRLLDMQGRVHMTASGVTSSVEWSVGHLPQGVYVLELVDGEDRTGRRRVVVNY